MNNCCAFFPNYKKQCTLYIAAVLTAGSRVLLGKLIGSQLVKKFFPFMQPEGSLPHSQKPSTCPYPEPYLSCSPTHFLKIHLNIIPFSSSFPTKTLHTSLPIRATCPAYLILLHFITQTILHEQYRSLSYSLCSFLYSPVTSSLWDPYIYIYIYIYVCVCVRTYIFVTIL